MKVGEMIEKLQQMPQDGELAINVEAYYYEGDDFDVIDDPEISHKTMDGRAIVYIGEVYANP